MLTLVALCVMLVSFRAEAGLDSYEIYLNGKLIMKHYVNQPLTLRMLQLEKENAAGQLVIRYTHCNVKGAGTDRSIAIRDGKGQVLKQWKFANNVAANESMTIPVRELLLLEKNNAGQELKLHYMAKELPEGEMLAALRLD